jgi:23S rRNA pseudouridine955/2504/2580 synthase
LSSEGFPIAGDDKYGDFDLNKSLLRAGKLPALKRMFLHAWRLQFNHPASGERIELMAQLPSELETFSNHAAPAPL